MATNTAAVFRAHHRRLLALQSATGANIGAAWDRLANVDERAAAEFTTAAAAISSASVAAAAALSNSMYDVLAPEVDGPIAPMIIRNGTDPAEVYQRSIVSSRYTLSIGGTWLVAMAAGRARAVSTARTDVMLANRAAAEVQGDARPEVGGFSRLLDPNACAYCAALGDETYSTADDVPLHPGCGCSVVPIIGKTDVAKTLNRQAVVSTLKDSSGAELTAKGYVSADGEPLDSPDVPTSITDVHVHGEMGAVLVPAGQSFASPDGG